MTNLTRRLCLAAGTTLAAASAANVAVIATVAKASEPDPIFAAIERCKEALAAEKPPIATTIPRKRPSRIGMAAIIPAVCLKR
jgi:hypothetical protein